VFQISNEISKKLKTDLNQLNYEILRDIEGVGSAKACQIMASFELARRYLIKTDVKITSPTDVIPLVSNIIDKKTGIFCLHIFKWCR
jgi:DNA repair protein RadC